MKEYKAPDVEIIGLLSGDVITESSGDWTEPTIQPNEDCWTDFY